MTTRSNTIYFPMVGKAVRGGHLLRAEAADLEKKSLNGISFRLFSLPFIMGYFLALLEYVVVSSPQCGEK